MAYKNPLELLKGEYEETKEPEEEFNPEEYKGKSIDELDKLGFEGWHNVIINNMRNSDYDTYEDVMAAANKRNFNAKQKAYIDAYARQVFGID